MRLAAGGGGLGESYEFLTGSGIGVNDRHGSASAVLDRHPKGIRDECCGLGQVNRPADHRSAAGSEAAAQVGWCSRWVLGVGGSAEGTCSACPGGSLRAALRYGGLSGGVDPESARSFDQSRAKAA